MTRTMRKAYTEIDEILKIMPEEYVNKIPKNMRELFKIARLEDYKVSVDPQKGLKEQNLIYDTLVILTFLKLNYWCDTEEEKKKLEQQLIDNEERMKEENDFNTIMERNNKPLEELPVKQERISWFSKMIAKIKRIFKK